MSSPYFAASLADGTFWNDMTQWGHRERKTRHAASFFNIYLRQKILKFHMNEINFLYFVIKFWNMCKMLDEMYEWTTPTASLYSCITQKLKDYVTAFVQAQNAVNNILKR